jgi:PAS domain S-box-containing protein
VSHAQWTDTSRLSKRRFSIVAGMRRMRVSQKLLAFCLSFTIPTAVLLYYYTQSVNETITFARKEQCGLRYNQSLRALIERPSAAGMDAVAAAGQQRCLSGTTDEALDTDAAFEKLQAAWQALQALPGEASANAFRAAAFALFTHVGDTSNLILDPDLDTYYVMDLVLIRFPESIALLSEATPRTATGAAAGLRRHVATVEHNLRVGFTHNDYYPGSRGTLKDAIDASLQRYLRSVRELVAVLERDGATPEAIAAARASVQAALYPLYDVAARWENRALDARASNRAAWKYFTIALITILLLLCGAFALLIGRDTVLRLVELEQVAAAMAKGKLDQSVTPRGRDEVATLARSFNKMASDLKQLYAGIEAQVQERTRALEQQTRQLELMAAVSEAANEASTPADALRIALDRVCAHMRWPVGHAWLLSAQDGAPILRSSGIWHLDEPAARFEKFRAATESARFGSGVGLPGRVLQEGGAIWVSDVLQDINFPRAKVADDIGVRAGFGFPILAGKNVVGVLEFFATEPLAPDDALLAAMASVGTHLGRVIEREHAAAALAEREARAIDAQRLLRDVTDNAPGFFFQLAIDPDGRRRYNFISRGIERVSGYTPEEVIADTSIVFRITDPQDQVAIRNAWAQSSQTMQPYHVDYRIRTKSGELRWLRGAGRPIVMPDGEMLWNGFTIDITAEKESEARIEATEKLLRDVTDNVPVVIYQRRLAPDGHITYPFLSAHFERMKPLVKKGDYKDEDEQNQAFAPEDRARIAETHRRSAELLEPYTLENRQRTDDGRLIWVRSAAVPRKEPDGSIVWNGYSMDITERKEIEQRLALAEQQMRDVIENLPGVVYQLRVDSKGLFKYDFVSQRNIDVWGVPREVSLQDPLAPHRLVVDEDQERVRREWFDSMRTLTPLSTEFRIRRPDGQLRWLRSNATPRPAGNGEVILNGHTLDITDTKEAESRVALAEQRLREFTEGLPGLVYQLEIEWGKPIRYNYLTDHTMQLYGLPREEVLKNPDRLNLMFDPRDMPRIFKGFQESLRNLTPIAADFRVRRADNGEIKWLRTYSIPRKSAKGVQINGFTMEISAEKEAEEKAAAAERLVREVTDSVPGIVYQMKRTPKGDVKMNFISRAVERIAGVPQEKAQEDFGAVMAAMFPEDRLAVAKAIQQSSLTIQPIPVGWRVRAPDGTVRYMHASAAIRKDEEGNVIWNGFAADVTQLKEYEAELAKAKEDAEAANRAKSDFLANMSHEIRTPMNAIIGLSQLALHSETLLAREKEYLDKIHRAARSLLGIINDVLDFSKIEAGKLALEETPFRLRDVLENVSSLIGMKAGEKDLDYSCVMAPEAPTALVGDPLRLGQILLNLAGNAVKFTDAGQVNVRVANERIDADGATLHFSVQDTGIGISEEKAAHLFESFFQADASTTRRYGGTGLGLSISRRLVEAMGGRIWAESEPGRGSTFHFTARFGLATQDQVEALPVAERVHRLDGVSLLVVEDNETNQIIAREILGEAGARVTIATNGREAVEAVEREAFDAVLMDVHMPVMDGHDATRAIRRQPRFAELPIIAMTASATVRDRELCVEAGMNAHVGKPIDLNELFGTLRRFVRVGAVPANGRGDDERGEIALPGLDVATGVRRLGGRREAYENLLKVFAASTPDPLPEIRDAIARGAGAHAVQLVHRLRGAAGNVAATRVLAVTTEMENTLKAGGAVDALLPMLERAWSELRDSLDRLLRASTAAAVAAADPATVRKELEHLDALLSRDDAEAVTLVRKLRGALAQGVTTIRFGELEKRVSNYDFIAAREALKALREDLDLPN